MNHELSGRKMSAIDENRLTWKLVFVASVLMLLMFDRPAEVSAATDSRTVSLAGAWQIRLDPDDQGLTDNWASQPLEAQDRINLPNTTDVAGLGFALDTNTMQFPVAFPPTSRFPGVAEPVRADEHGYPVRRHLFVGPAWYERTVEIPSEWRYSSIVFTVERTMWKTDVWLDGKHMGSGESLVAEHQFDLGRLSPGDHRLTVRVDNRMLYNISTITHAYGPETQTRWNGLLGRIELEARNRIQIRSINVFPSADCRSALVKVRLMSDAEQTATINVALRGESSNTPAAEATAEVLCSRGETGHELNVELAEPAVAWDEFSPVLYQAKVRIGRQGNPAGERAVTFGFRQVERRSKGLYLNGHPIFLRGTLDCCVYPRTGHPPMTVDEWTRTFQVVKNHGFNHVRFHTWCPPEAAFEAADRLGLYLQPEAPAWIDDWVLNTITKPQGIGKDPQVWEYLRRENRRITETYGNHPSFLMFTIGNEFGMNATDWDAVNDEVAALKELDPRRLYSGCTARRLMKADDFWTTHQTAAATRGVGPAHTDWDFAKAVETSVVPVISHETGQRPVFPDYPSLLPKFSGPLLPLNLRRYQRAFLESGMADQAGSFVRASALFQLVQYKAEHEAMLRTLGLGGYQLLMLNDFTGQSEALVGVLDPFWDSKGIVSVKDVRRWNNPTVPLARFSKYGWNQDELFRAKLELAHFGNQDLRDQSLVWHLRTGDDQVISEGKFAASHVRRGTLSTLGEISVPLTNLSGPAFLTLDAQIGGAENAWRIWVYPAREKTPVPEQLLVVHSWSDSVSQALAEGKRVLFLAHGLTNSHAARTGFESVYWSAGWWGNRFSMLGIVCDPSHPALAAFPNQGHSDWNWRDLCSGATTLQLPNAPAGLRPVIQGVPDFHYNSLLSHLFEVRVGNGALAVCGYDLESKLETRPAARQFRESLISYLTSPKFKPQTEATESWVAELLSTRQQ